MESSFVIIVIAVSLAFFILMFSRIGGVRKGYEYCKRCKQYTIWKMGYFTRKNGTKNKYSQKKYRCSVYGCSNTSRASITTAINWRVPRIIQFCINCSAKTKWFKYPKPECSRCGNFAITTSTTTGHQNYKMRSVNMSFNSDTYKSSWNKKTAQQSNQTTVNIGMTAERLKYENNFFSKLRKDKLFGKYTVNIKNKYEIECEGIWKKKEKYFKGKFFNSDKTAVHYGRLDYAKDQFEGKVYERATIEDATKLLMREGKFIFKDGRVVLKKGKLSTPDITIEGLFEDFAIINGSVKHTNGHKAEGKFKNNRLIKGRFDLPDGTYFEGILDWDENTCDGEGYIPKKNLYLEGLINFKEVKIISKKGKIRYTKEDSPETETHEGVFKDQILIEGKKVLFSGIIEEGIFKDGRLFKGKRIYKDGTIEEGDFTDGIHNK